MLVSSIVLSLTVFAQSHSTRNPVIYDDFFNHLYLRVVPYDLLPWNQYGKINLHYTHRVFRGSYLEPQQSRAVMDDRKSQGHNNAS